MEPDRRTDLIGQEAPPSQGWVRLARYLVNDLPTIERAEVERWLAADPRRATAIAELRVAWGRHEEPQAPVDVEQALRAVVRQLGLRDGALPEGHGKEGRPLFRHPTGWTFPRYGWAVAAMAVAAVVGVRHIAKRVAPISMLTYSTGNGERANIALPDGSRVSLNVASRLEVPADYAAGNHAVRLSGEALFTVSHRDRSPFVVLAGKTAARVLGTSFIVRHYAADTTSLVAVRDGKVGVGATVLTAQRMAEVGRSGVPRVGAADPSLFSFAAGVLTLGDMPLSQAIPELDRWYDTDLRLGDSTLANQRVRGKFSAGSLTDLASILEWTFSVRVVRDGRVLTLYPKR